MKYKVKFEMWIEVELNDNVTTIKEIEPLIVAEALDIIDEMNYEEISNELTYITTYDENDNELA